MFQELGIGATHKKLLEAGETLFERGGPVVAFYELDTGKIRMSRIIADGKLVTFYQVRRGQLFAEASLFSDTYHCEAVATEDSVVHAYSKAEFLRALKADHERAFSFMAHLARQVQDQRAHMEILHIRTAPDRLLAYIQSKIGFGEDGFELGSTWKDVASEINLSHEAVYRALAVLEKNGSIKRDGGYVMLGDAKGFHDA